MPLLETNGRFGNSDIFSSGSDSVIEAAYLFGYNRIMNLRSARQHSGWMVAAALLFTLAVLPYLQTLGYEFVNFDDHEYVFKNPQVLQGLTWANVGWAFTTFTTANWHPLTWLSHMADCQFWGQRGRPPPGQRVLAWRQHAFAVSSFCGR